MLQYWIDFFGAILNLIKNIFLTLVFIILFLAAVTLIPLWVFGILFAVLCVYLYAHGVAIDKENRRKMIDTDIEAWKANIEHKENIIVNMYQHIADSEPDEDTRRYVLAIENAEEEIERIKKKIKQLELQRSCV